MTRSSRQNEEATTPCHWHSGTRRCIFILMMNLSLLPRLLPAALICVALSTPASAFVSQWAETDGGRMRVAIDPVPSEPGVYRGALEINLDEGWKTYWQEPGSAGIPPLLDFSGGGLSLQKTGFPAPVRIHDGDVSWVGYKKSIALALTFAMPDGADTSFSANVFVGVCEKICVPFQASFSGTLDTSGPEDDAAAITQAAFAALPETPQADFHVREASIEGDVIDVSVALPAFRPSGVEAALFAVPAAGFTLGVPKLMPTSGTDARFEIPVIKRPADFSADQPVPLALTVTFGNRAIGVETQAR